MKNKTLQTSDYYIFLTMSTLIIFGIVMISSATKTQQYLEGYWEKQIVWFFVGAVLMLIVMSIDYNIMGEFTKYMYIVNLIMLLAVKFTSAGVSKLGAQRWIDIGPIRLQPSEFAKIIMIIALAKLIDKKASKINSPKTVIQILIYAVIPIVLIESQPDLGTSLVVLAITVAMLFVAGLAYKYFLGAILFGFAAFPILWFKVLKTYQKSRILVFLNPELDSQGVGYHVTQSKIAIGSGNLTGKGVYHGGFTQSNYLPECHTDFIFGVVGEELGFIGSAILIALLIFLIFQILRVAGQANDIYGKLICIGVAAMLGFQVLINAGMTMGIMPVTGIPLPFISYGGSSLWINMMSIGLVMNVAKRKKNLKFSQ